MYSNFKFVCKQLVWLSKESRPKLGKGHSESTVLQSDTKEVALTVYYNTGNHKLCNRSSFATRHKFVSGPCPFISIDHFHCTVEACSSVSLSITDAEQHASRDEHGMNNINPGGKSDASESSFEFEALAPRAKLPRMDSDEESGGSSSIRGLRVRTKLFSHVKLFLALIFGCFSPRFRQNKCHFR